MFKKLRRLMFALSGSAAALLIFHFLRQRGVKTSPLAAKEALINVDEVLPEDEPVVEEIAVAPEVSKEPEPAPEPVSTPASKPDDLKRIEGIGPKTSAVLNTAGITTFQALADHTAEEIKEILRAAKSRGVPTTWPEQAKLAAAEDWDGLDKLQDELKGGR